MGMRHQDALGRESLLAPTPQTPLSHTQPYRESLKLCHSLETGLLQ